MTKKHLVTILSVEQYMLQEPALSEVKVEKPS